MGISSRRKWCIRDFNFVSYFILKAPLYKKFGIILRRRYIYGYKKGAGVM